MNQRYNKKETTQQKEQTANHEYKFPLDDAFDNKEQGTNDKQDPTVQLKAYFSPYSLMMIFHGVSSQTGDSPQTILDRIKSENKETVHTKGRVVWFSESLLPRDKISNLC